MSFYRRWFLVAFALAVSAGSLLAASREERAYAAAVAAFHDKFYDRAAASLTQYLQNYRKSTNAPAATLMLAQSEFYLGKYTNVVARLTDTNSLARANVVGLADDYAYWQAEAQFAAGDYPGAAQTFVSVAKNFPDSTLAVEAVVEAAAAHEKMEQWAQVDDLLGNTNGLFQRAAQLDPANKTVADGRLLQSESRYAQHDFAGAVRILNLLNPTTLTPEQDWKRAHQLYRATLQMDELEAALSAATNMLAIARAGHGGSWMTNFAESVVCRATVLERQNRLAEAAAAWQDALAAGVPADSQEIAVLKIAELAEAQGKLADAEAALEKFLAQFSDSAAAGLARLTAGELYLKDHLAQPGETNRLLAAQAQFDQLLAVSANGPLAGKAYLDRGWCDWLNGQFAESFADFQAAAPLLAASTDALVARFKAGDAQFALTNWAGAETNYQAVLDELPDGLDATNSLGDCALFQILCARLALHQNGAEDAMSRLLGKFFTNATPNSRQLLGKFFNNTPASSSLLLANFGSPARVREAFREFASERTNSPLLPQVSFAVARTFEREQNWPAAAAACENWLKNYPADGLRPQVEYARDWAVWQAGDEDRAFVLFTNFFGQFPTNALAPLAHWWVADHFFRLGSTNFSEAERNYELIFQDFPASDLAYPAQLMAGRAAMGRSGYKDASGYFVSLINDTNAPADMAVQARFGYAEALRQMNGSDTNNVSLQQATNVLAQICPLAATNVAGALAWSELGDCDLQLGALDAATNAFWQAFNSPSATAELRCRAQVGLGIVLEKKAENMPADDRTALLGQALNHYLDVVYSPADEFWVKKAGLQALPLISLLESDEAKQRFFDRLETLLPPLKETLEKKRAATSKG